MLFQGMGFKVLKWKNQYFIDSPKMNCGRVQWWFSIASLTCPLEEAMRDSSESELGMRETLGVGAYTACCSRKRQYESSLARWKAWSYLLSCFCIQTMCGTNWELSKVSIAYIRLITYNSKQWHLAATHKVDQKESFTTFQAKYDFFTTF